MVSSSSHDKFMIAVPRSCPAAGDLQRYLEKLHLIVARNAADEILPLLKKIIPNLKKAHSIFARLEHTLHGHMITYTRWVRYIVGKEHPLVVPDEIITSIQNRMEDGIIGPPAEQFEKGEQIMINDGPFRDFSGVFERDLPGRERVVILLNALHGSLELDRGALRKLP